MPEVTPFQVLIVDDHPLMRRGIRQLLELDPAFHVVAEAGDGASAIDLANRIEPDLILLDLNMKGLSGLDTLNALRRDGVTAQIIILTVSDSASDIYALIDAGADGYPPGRTSASAPPRSPAPHRCFSGPGGRRS
ncbi:response regulator, partial [Salmonella enterica]